jgi:cation-transporting ATPase I
VPPATAQLGKALTHHLQLPATVTAAPPPPSPGSWPGRPAPEHTADTVALVALVALVSSQLLQTLQDAGRDRVVAAAAVRSLVVLGVVVTVPGLSHFFGNRPLGPAGWTIALASAAGSVLVPAAVRLAAGALVNVHPQATGVQPLG